MKKEIDDKQTNQKRKHFFDITQEQKERIFERDLAARRSTERMTPRQRRFVDSILSNSTKPQHLDPAGKANAPKQNKSGATDV